MASSRLTGRPTRADGITLGLLVLATACAPGARVVSRPAAPPGHDTAIAAGEHTLSGAGLRLWYRVAGDAASPAAPVVFLHGGPGQGSAHFEALVGRHLEHSVQLVYLDQRGSGRSERPPDQDYAIASFVADIDSLRHALGVPRISLIGHSFGALLALEYAAAHPAAVAGVVVVSGLWDVPYQCRLRLQTLARLRPLAYQRVRGDTLTAEGRRRNDCELEFSAFESEAERDAYNTAAMFPDPRVEARLDSVDAAHGIRNTGEISRALFGSGVLLGYQFRAHQRVTAPVLVIAGRHDGAARPEGLRTLAERLPNARFLEFEDSGHFVYLDEPQRFAREVTEFLERVGR